MDQLLILQLAKGNNLLLLPYVDQFELENRYQLVKLFIKYKDKSMRGKISKLNYKNGRKYFGISIHGNELLQVLKNVINK